MAVTRPRSVSTTWINLTALGSLFGALFLLRHLQLDDRVTRLLIVWAAIAVPIVGLELWTRKTVLVEGNGTNSQHLVGRPARVIIKLLGLVASGAALVVIYWTFPYFKFGDSVLVYELFFAVWIPLLALTPIYFWYVDARMEDPEDGYYKFGLFVLGRHQFDKAVKQHVLAWIVKIFFFQYILSVTYPHLQHFLQTDLTRQLFAPDFAFMNVFIDTVWLIDVCFSSLGYFATLRLFDTHVRSTEPTLFGWVACMLCYGPAYAMLVSSYLAYEDNYYWGHWLYSTPTLKALWAILIIICLSIYALSSMQFGLRFSNLTHRGIITNGTYRLTKHPQYLFKNIAWWLISVPFIHSAGTGEAIRFCLMLAGMNCIFYMRAITEEKHLSWDPDYRAYAAWIEEHGIVGRLRRLVFSGRKMSNRNS